ncbi:acyltransferase family protein [Butyrivibrio sp. JL13D10]|uniref:acyltransferase family protein n=1 Tax=Butyrivibrio sp. JL13D10 TaxID=3236815 RepID=UPI0038B62F9D
MRNKTFDKIKAVACIFVILIHCKFPSVYGDLFEALARFGVPMFFAIAGVYLSASSANGQAETDNFRRNIMRKLKRTGAVTLKVWAIYTLYSFVYAMAAKYGAAAWFKEKFNSFEFSRLILFNSGKFIYDFTYGFDHMWYLLALLYVYFLCYMFAPAVRVLSKPLTIILLGFLFLGEMLQIYYPIRPFGINISTWYVVRNWLFVGIPFTMLGYWMKESGAVKKIKQPMTLGSVLVITGVFSTLAEFKLWGQVEVYVGSLIIVLGLLIVGLDAGSDRSLIETKKTEEPRSLLSYIGENLSSNIYYYHVMVISVLGFLTDRVYPDAYENAFFMYLRPVIVITITILISLLIYMVKFITFNSNKNLRK